MSCLIAIPSGILALAGLTIACLVGVGSWVIGFEALGLVGALGTVVATCLLVTGLSGTVFRGQVRLVTLPISGLTFLGLAFFIAFLFIGSHEVFILKEDPGKPISGRYFSAFFQTNLKASFQAIVDYGKCSLSVEKSVLACTADVAFSKTLSSMMDNWTSSPAEKIIRLFSGCAEETPTLWCLGGRKFTADVHAILEIAKYVAAVLAGCTLLVFSVALFPARKKQTKRHSSRVLP